MKLGVSCASCNLCWVFIVQSACWTKYKVCLKRNAHCVKCIFVLSVHFAMCVLCKMHLMQSACCIHCMMHKVCVVKSKVHVVQSMCCASKHCGKYALRIKRGISGCRIPRKILRSEEDFAQKSLCLPQVPKVAKNKHK